MIGRERFRLTIEAKMVEGLEGLRAARKFKVRGLGSCLGVECREQYLRLRW